MDAAFDRAEQSYPNPARALAGVIAVLLAVGAGFLLSTPAEPIDLRVAALVGLLAVPIAPIAKDLVGALTAAARAVKPRDA